MARYTHAIDANASSFFVFDYDPQTGTLSGGLRRDPEATEGELRILNNLAGKMTLQVGSQTIRPEKNQDTAEEYINHFSVQLPEDRESRLGLLFRNRTFGNWVMSPEKPELKNIRSAGTDHKLTAFEMRLLGRRDDMPEIPYDRDAMSLIRPRTDLHTHFAAIPRAGDLLDMALEKPGEPIIYPRCLLESLDINCDPARLASRPPEDKLRLVREAHATGDQSEGIPLRRENFSESDLKKIRKAMAIPLDRQGTFMDLEGVFDYRMPITKNREMFEPLLNGIAGEYKRQGIEYAEISFTKMLDPGFVQEVNEKLPKIEKKHGVKLRFLAGLVRHMDDATNNYNIEKIKKLSRSPYIVGADFIGEETNSTKAFKRQLNKLCKWASDESPDFTVRVHAGESSKFPDNVKDALRIGKKYGVRMRI